MPKTNKKSKEFILDSIRETATKNNGVVLGMDSFEVATGIRRDDWRGKYWAKWNDAIKEAGFEPNEFSIPAFNIDWIIIKIIELIRELGEFPSRDQLKIKKINDENFPSSTTIKNRLGIKPEMVSRIIEFCNKNNGYSDIISICSEINIETLPSHSDDTENSQTELGFVYLAKSGKFYKIGKTNHIGRRDYELKIQLPEKVELIHQISTDDPTGIEIYWHNRFSSKRKNGEWFELNNDDVKAFKRRKFM